MAHYFHIETFYSISFIRDVAAEERELADEAKDFKAYPVLRFGVTYRF